LSQGPALRLFEAIGIELEYMIVDRGDLGVRPIADELIRAKAGHVESEIENGDVAWSNELALHLIELKTNGPAPGLAGLAERFQANVVEVNALLAPLEARLLPTAMHPWMDPAREFRRWPHEYGPVYAAFDRIFGCSGHGWANLQSVHVNLPFSGDEEFGRLHAAVRLVLPLLPALAASSPVLEGEASGALDTRLELYRGNARRVPSVSGRVIPEPVFTREEYQRLVLEPIYRDLEPLDPEGVLRHEWVNARGCIPRFDRSAIEIRLLDVQECPAADLAVAAATVGAVRALVEERWSSGKSQRDAPGAGLEALFTATLRQAEDASVSDRGYLELLGWSGEVPCRARELWRHLVEATVESDPALRGLAGPLRVILEEGCLARRILGCLGEGFDRAGLRSVYAELADHLQAGTQLRGRD
jgi:carboxylate-amine ligase